MKLKQNYKLQSDIIIYKYVHAYILSIHILYVYRFATPNKGFQLKDQRWILSLLFNKISKSS